MTRRYAEATQRNREPIFEVLRRLLPATGAHVLEVASGSGEHAVHLAPRLEVASWQPSDLDPEARASIDAWRSENGSATVLHALALDVSLADWPSRVLHRPVDLLFCANMIHIAPVRAGEGLLEGAREVLVPGGLVCLYGPFRRGGRHTAPSNEAFDAGLRQRNPTWGVRDLETVTRHGEAHGLMPMEVVEMPSNNLVVAFRAT